MLYWPSRVLLWYTLPLPRPTGFYGVPAHRFRDMQRTRMSIPLSTAKAESASTRSLNLDRLNLQRRRKQARELHSRQIRSKGLVHSRSSCHDIVAIHNLPGDQHSRIVSSTTAKSNFNTSGCHENGVIKIGTIDLFHGSLTTSVASHLLTCLGVDSGTELLRCNQVPICRTAACWTPGQRPVDTSASVNRAFN